MTDQPAPYYPNYATVGPPSHYNGTGATGGNSGTGPCALLHILAEFLAN